MVIYIKGGYFLCLQKKSTFVLYSILGTINKKETPKSQASKRVNKLAHRDLDNAKKQKLDEFYTQLIDIEQELKYYKDQFKGKTVFCNCDDPYWSDFFYFFVAKFNEFGLKKLITTHYIDNDITLFDDIKPEHPYSLSITKTPQDLLSLERPAMVTHIIAENGGRKPLKGDGDFRSDECVEMLKEADIVVTNPPFSLFREFLNLLTKFEKLFLIIGNKNAITYKECFKLIKDEKMWLGYRNINSDIWFRLPDYAEKWERLDKGKKLKHISACWFTNLDTTKRHEKLILYEKYTSAKYPQYDNYDAINIDKVTDIPFNYKGVMGVPLTFLDKYNPEQFEILGMSASAGYNKEIVGIPFLGDKDARPLINSKNTYARIFIRNRHPEKKE